MVAVADPNGESLMDKSELNSRYKARSPNYKPPEVLLNCKPPPSVCGNLSQLLTIRS
jgi:hypothetical protein